MKIDPNRAVGMEQECVLCESGFVVLHDGARSSLEELERNDSAFRRFCGTIDPNRCYLLALIPDDRDREVFFRARDVARRMGIHMQATVEKPEELAARWQQYRELKSGPAQPPADS